MNDRMGFGAIKELWTSGNEKNRIEVGRREMLLLGVRANESRQRINSKIMKFGAQPYSIPDHDAMKKAENPWRLERNFAQVCF